MRRRSWPQQEALKFLSSDDIIRNSQYSTVKRIFTFTGDRDIMIYDSISLELYCRIGGLSSVPLRVSHYADDFKVILLMGDEKGVISILIMKRLGDTLRLVLIISDRSISEW